MTFTFIPLAFQKFFVLILDIECFPDRTLIQMLMEDDKEYFRVLLYVKIHRTF